MQLTVLGSGTAVPVPDRFPAGYLVEHAEHRLMVDCGPGTLRRLAQTSATPATLDAVLLTHYHTDHCADLAALLISLRSPHLNPRPPLTVYGAPGLTEGGLGGAGWLGCPPPAVRQASGVGETI